MSSDDTKRVLEGAVPMVGQEIGELISGANEALNQLAKDSGLSKTVDAAPYTMVVAAVGVGYILGGGLYTPTTTRLLSLGMKLLSVPIIQNQLLEVAEAAVDQFVSQAKKYTEPK